ncbi:MAG: glycosyltransferase family 2 protein [Candidatus Magasanikbacteria bacterium]
MIVDQRKKISVVTPCFNEEDNVSDVYEQTKAVFVGLLHYDYEHIFIDNASTDRTVSILKQIAQLDKNVKIIVNTRNFGHICSPIHALLQARGDAVIMLLSDLQDPPILMKEFIKKWEEGYKVVIGIKNKSLENPLMFFIRKIYYTLIKKFAEIEQINNFFGYGLYDRKFIEVLRQINDPYPYFRGLINEIGFERTEIFYTQFERKKGKSKNNFYTLYDVAMLGFVNHSKVPLRMASFIGFIISVISFIIAIIYLAYKLLYWQEFQLGLAPLIIGIFFFSSVQLFFIGILGEYIGAIYTQVKHRPMVIEKERVNFE